MKAYAKSFNNYVRKLITQQGLSMSQFTERAHGLKNSTGSVYPVITGKAVLTEEKAAKWAPVLGVTPEMLLEANAHVREKIREEKMSPRKNVSDPIRPTTFRTFMHDLFRERQMNEASFSRLLGMTSSGGVNQIINGKATFTEMMRHRWAEALGISEEVLKEAHENATPLPDDYVRQYNSGRARKRRRGSHQRGPRVVHKEPQSVVSRSVVEEKTTTERDKRFSFVINEDGTVNIRLNVPDLPVDAALKLVAALELPDLLQGD